MQLLCNSYAKFFQSGAVMSRRLCSLLLLLLQPSHVFSADEPAPVDRQGDGLPAGVIARLGSGRLHHDATVLGVALSRDGRMLASAGDDFTTRLWDPNTGKEVRRFWQTLTRTDRNAAARTVHCLALSPDGKQLVVGLGDGTIRLWETAGGKELRKLQGSQGPVFCIAFSRDGKLLASGGADQAIRLWDPNGGKVIRQLAGQDQVHAAVFSPDGKTLATGGGDGMVRIWNPATGMERRAFEAHKGTIRSLAFTPEVAIAWSDSGICRHCTTRFPSLGSGADYRHRRRYQSLRASNSPHSISKRDVSPDMMTRSGAFRLLRTDTPLRPEAWIRVCASGILPRESCAAPSPGAWAESGVLLTRPTVTG
jgi:hypothetical protein